MSNRARRTLARAAEDHRAQVAAATVAAAGVAVAGKVGFEKLQGNGQPDGPSRAYRLKSKERPKRGIRRIARGRADNALEELGAAGEQAVHEARKDLKKLRSVLRLVRDEIGDPVYRRENRRFRDAGRALSAARDATVKLQTLSSLRERFPEQLDGDATKGFQAVLEEEHTATAKAVDSEAGPVSDAAAAIEKGRTRIADWPLGTQEWELVGPGLVRNYRRGRKAFSRTLADPSAENVHEWRKRSKDLWYHLRILRDAWPQVVGTTTDQAHELGDLLGDHHDLVVLADDARERPHLFADRDDERALAELAARRQEELLTRAIDLGSRLYAEKPKAFGRRFEGYWRAWRPA
jgi:CHAD domain-containing protein